MERMATALPLDLALDPRGRGALRLPETLPPLPMLTPAERRVTQLLQAGLDHQTIAEVRGTSLNTVGNQIAAIFSKLGVASRYELSAWVAWRSAGASPV